MNNNIQCQPASRMFLFGDKSLDLAKPQVMGILNVTPDSFSDGGELLRTGSGVLMDKALSRACAMVEAGAAIVDIGGESTRPGAEEVSSQEEIDRVLPLLERIRASLDVIVSVDTSNPALMQLCAGAGAGLINDVRALAREGAIKAAAESGLPICLMHMQGQPRTMQHDPVYEDVVSEVSEFLLSRINACEKAGISRGRLMLDPGFGFGKQLQHNLSLMSRLEDLVGLGLPVLVGVSRKNMIGALTGKSVDKRMAGSITAAVMAVIKGAAIVRVHDVAETVDALKVASAIWNYDL
jgi:dihydropteroate synthase